MTEYEIFRNNKITKIGVEVYLWKNKEGRFFVEYRNYKTAHEVFFTADYMFPVIATTTEEDRLHWKSLFDKR